MLLNYQTGAASTSSSARDLQTITTNENKNIFANDPTFTIRNKLPSSNKVLGAKLGIPPTTLSTKHLLKELR